MRRRIVIGLLAVLVVIGAVAFFVSQPKHGSVEWHKRKYMAAIGGGCPNLVRLTLGYFVGLDRSVLENETRQKAARKAESHRAALVTLGYLTERRFAITNRGFNEFLKATLENRRQFSKGHPPWAIRESVAPTNVLVVTGLPDIVSQYDELVRTSDLPENHK